MFIHIHTYMSLCVYIYICILWYLTGEINKRQTITVWERCNILFEIGSTVQTLFFPAKWLRNVKIDATVLSSQLLHANKIIHQIYLAYQIYICWFLYACVTTVSKIINVWSEMYEAVRDNLVNNAGQNNLIGELSLLQSFYCNFTELV